MKYTTQGNIALRLAKRLQVGGAPQTYGKDVLDPALLELVSVQVEARLELSLAALYLFPLQLTEPNTVAIVGSCVEKLILGEVLPVHFFAEVGKEGGLRKVMADEGLAELKALQDGTVKLDGERITPQQGYLSGAVRVVKRKPGDAEAIQW